MKILDLEKYIFRYKGRHFRLKKAELKSNPILNQFFPSLNLHFFLPAFEETDKNGKKIVIESAFEHDIRENDLKKPTNKGEENV